MGCLNNTNIKLDYIQDFEMMFERMKINRPREAAIYYSILIIDSPKEFSDYLKIAEELANTSRRPLETGRSSLLKNGLIAKVLFSNNSKENFGRESYLPIHPRVIWEIIRNDLKHYIAEDTYKLLESHLEIYNNFYNENFEKYGIKIKREGTVTIQYNAKWIIYTLLNNCYDNKNHLKMQVGGRRLLEEPFINYFKKFLDMNTKIKLIIDQKIDNKTIDELMKIYGDKLEIRLFSEEVSGTLRNYVYGKELAVNGIKILSESDSEPSYIGTAYVDLEDVEILNEKFNNLWNLAKPY
jgi:hypothetical protein